MQLIFEKGVSGRRTSQYPELDVHEEPLDKLTGGVMRAAPAELPELAEVQVIRHYQELGRRNLGVDDAFYPLGSCTMKYNPKVNEAAAAMVGFAGLHPYVEFFRAQGTMALLRELERLLCEITGMRAFSLHPMAGAHGEWVGMSIIREYHEASGAERSRVLVPDSCHGTNPASATMAGFTVDSVKSDARGEVDIDDLKSKLCDDVAAIMLTNPNTLGLFESRISEIADLVHGCGGLLYYDGANFNAILGKCRPADMGFDVVHLNIHKTFSTPHGGGGPGSGPVGVVSRLEPFLPVPRIVENPQVHPQMPLVWSMDFPKSMGRVAGFFGNVAVLIRAYVYIRMLGEDGLRQASEDAVLAANYLKERLRPLYPPAFDRPCMHEFVATPGALLEKGVRAVDVAKALIDRGFHPPTMYFPLIVPEALMVEPTETETLETLDRFADAMREIAEKAADDPEWIRRAPYSTPVSRVDETRAAREAVLTAPAPEPPAGA
ncbi:MAG: aminomethyl-transferring glycine dehydrogenase subunit GcvPB [Planctomycetota bacterium]|jgi:glycine dehydrogenase subunit 2